MEKTTIEKGVGVGYLLSGLYFLVSAILEFPVFINSLESWSGSASTDFNYYSLLIILTTINLLFIGSRILLGIYTFFGRRLNAWQFYTLLALVLLGGGYVGILLVLISVILRFNLIKHLKT